MLRKAGAAADREVLQARGEVGKLRADLDDWRLSAARGATSPESLAVIEAELTVKIREANVRADRASIPPALRDLLEPGADVRQRWADATLAAKRDVIRTLMEVRVRPSGQNSFMPTHERVDVTWKET